MQPISAPIPIKFRGPAVANLHEGLVALIKAQVIVIPETNRAKFEEGLRNEQTKQLYHTYTEAVLQIFRRSRKLTAKSEVDEATANALNDALRAIGVLLSADESLEVRGVLRDARGLPMPEREIRVYDIDFRSERLLGASRIQTAADGTWIRTYSSEQVARPEHARPGILVRAYAGEQVIAESKIHFNAPSALTVDLQVMTATSAPADDAVADVTPSEYEVLCTSLVSVIDKELIGRLTERDVHFVVGELELDEGHVRLLRTANAFAIDTEGEQANANGPHPVTAVYYALMRQGLPADLRQLLAQTFEVLEQTLKRAVEAFIVPRKILAGLPQAHDHLQRALARLAMRPPAAGERPGLPQVLETVLPEPELREEMLALLARHRGSEADFWTALAGRSAFSNRIEAVQSGLRLGALTSHHVPLEHG